MPAKLTKLQGTRYVDAVKEIERLAERRERALTTVVRMTLKITALARQVRRYEKMKRK